jgi:hypothetical protein
VVYGITFQTGIADERKIKKTAYSYEEIFMKRSESMTVFLTLTLLLCFAMPAGAFEIGARGLYWIPSFKADIKVDSDGVVGNTLNLKETLGVKDEYFPSFEIFIGHAGHHLNIAYTPMAYSGSTSLTRDITFNGRTFATGSRVETDLKLRMYDLEYRYTFLDFENLAVGFSFDAIGQVKVIDTEARINAPTNNIGAAGKFQAPMLMVGLGTHVGILRDLLEARVKATGMAYSNSYLYEAQADLSLTPLPFLDIHIGYKMIRLKIDQGDVFLDSEFAGPYVGLTVSF